ncbi:MAG: MCE family protein [Acidimicrobiales bacterium]
MKKMSKGTGRSAIKFAIYGVVCLVALFLLARQIGNISFFSHRVGFAAQLPDATGLHPSDDVKIAGVTVGQVSSVTVQHGYALVKFSVDKSQAAQLRSSTQVGLRWRNVLGLKYLYLYPGSTGADMKPGAVIPLSQAVSSADIGAFLNALGPFLSAINPQEANAFVAAILGGLQGNEAQVTSLLGNTASLSSTLGGLDTQVGSVITNLTTVLEALASRNSDLNNIITNLTSASQILSNRNDALQGAVVNFGQLAGQFKNLISTNRGNLDGFINNLQSVTNVLSQHHADLAKGLATLTTGFAPYQEISNYGQWFQVRVVYLCLANETTCSYEQPLSGSSPLRPASASGSAKTASVSPIPSGPATPHTSAGLPAAPHSMFTPQAPSLGGIYDFASSANPVP